MTFINKNTFIFLTSQILALFSTENEIQEALKLLSYNLAKCTYLINIKNPQHSPT